jgi:prostaglandin-E synthase 1
MPNVDSFHAYILTAVALCVNVLFLWGYSGAVRARVKIAVNPEDAARLKIPLEAGDPPEVARVLRAHANAQAMIFPFLILGFLFVLAGGDATFAKVVFGIFVAARVIHSFVYLAGRQPWRTLFFVVGALATVVLMGDLVWLLFRGTAT